MLFNNVHKPVIIYTITAIKIKTAIWIYIRYHMNNYTIHFYSISWWGPTGLRPKKIIIYYDVVYVRGHHRNMHGLISHNPTAPWRFYWAVLIIADPISAVPLPSFIDWLSWLYITVVKFVVLMRATSGITKGSYLAVKQTYFDYCCFLKTPFSQLVFMLTYSTMAKNTATFKTMAFPSFWNFFCLPLR